MGPHFSFFVSALPNNNRMIDYKETPMQRLALLSWIACNKINTQANKSNRSVIGPTIVLPHPTNVCLCLLCSSRQAGGQDRGGIPSGSDSGRREPGADLPG